MHQHRLMGIIAAVALLYVAYIAIALWWHRLCDSILNGRRRDGGPSGFTIPPEYPRSVYPGQRPQ
jgi:hypothetical protein